MRREVVGHWAQRLATKDSGPSRSGLWRSAGERVHASFSFARPVKSVGEECRDFLWKENHSHDYGSGRPQQKAADPSATDGTLLCAVLLPESQGKQCGRQSEKPRPQGCEECTCGTRS